MQVMRDPVRQFLSYLSQIPMTAPLCMIHSDEQFVKHAEKVTKIIHEIYPTESENLGYYVDNDNFSLEGKNALDTVKQLKESREKLTAVARRAGFDLQYEHKSYDNMMKDIVDLPFSANWIDTPVKFYEHGPSLIFMPTEIMGHVLAQTTFRLEPEHEELFQLKIEEHLE